MPIEMTATALTLMFCIYEAWTGYGDVDVIDHEKVGYNTSMVQE